MEVLFKAKTFKNMKPAVSLGLGVQTMKTKKNEHRVWMSKRFRETQ